MAAMTEPFASGDWHVTEGKEEEFVERWTAWLLWTRETQPSLVEVSLIQDQGDARHFISFARWKDTGAREAWKNSEGFMERFSACHALCEDFHGGDYERVVAI